MRFYLLRVEGDSAQYTDVNDIKDILTTEARFDESVFEEDFDIKEVKL